MLTSYDLLPEWTFVGGESQSRGFRFLDSKGDYLELEGAIVTLSVTRYMDETQYKTETQKPTLEYRVQMSMDESERPCLAAFFIPASDTAELYGKFTYQLTIRTSAGLIGIPFRGQMYIVRNIHPYAINYTETS